MKTSEQTNEIATALAKAQADIEMASKDATNPHYKSKYASFAAVIKASRKALTSHGLSVIQGGAYKDGHWILVTRISHSSGQWYETEFPLIARDQSAQAMGSATTYAKRYSFEAMTGTVSDDDDDGEGAMSRPSFIQKPAPQPHVSPVKPIHAVPQQNPDRLITDDEWRTITTKIKETLKLDNDALVAFVRDTTGKTTRKTLTVSDLQQLNDEVDMKVLDGTLPL